MAATPCSGIPLSERNFITTYNSATDYILTIDSSQPFGQKTKRIKYESIFSGWTTGNLEIKNNTPGATVKFTLKNSSAVEGLALELNPDQQAARFTYSIRGASLTVTASNDNIDATRVFSLVVDSTSGNITINGFQNGISNQVIFVHKEFSVNTVTINHQTGTGSQKIITPDGLPISLTLFGGMTLKCNGTNWYVLKY